MPETPGVQLDAATITSLREKCKEDLFFLAKGVLGFDLLNLEIHLPICLLLEDQENTRLKIVLPRSWLKSTLMIAYAVWCAIRNPNIRILIVQNSHNNACKKLAVIRGIFESCALFRALFPELLPTKECTWSNDSLSIPRSITSAEGTFEAAGTRTKLTSRHYDKIIEDDTVSPDLDDLTDGVLLPSKEDVEQAIGWHRLATPLLVDPLKSQIIIVGTRWFEKDLISWNTDNQPEYKSYFRAVKETNGLADEDGTVTYPERFPQKVLDSLEHDLGPYMYSCLYMNKPIRSGDMTFQPEWFRYYETPPRDLITYTSIDPSGDPMDAKGEPDPNVVLTTGKDLRTGKIYVLDYFRAKCNPSEVITALFDHVRRFSPVQVRLEAVAYQRSLAYWIRERMRSDNLYFMVEPVTHGNRTKGTRIQGLQPLVKGGMLLFRTHHRALVSELCAFPLAANDDLGDALSMQIPMWAMTRSAAEEKRGNPEDNPFSFESAVKEIRVRTSERVLETDDTANAWSNVGDGAYV